MNQEEINAKALEIVQKYYPLANGGESHNFVLKKAKDCALIACDERIDECNNFDRTDGYVQKRIDELSKVKQAIENL